MAADGPSCWPPQWAVVQLAAGLPRWGRGGGPSKQRVPSSALLLQGPLCADDDMGDVRVQSCPSRCQQVQGKQTQGASMV